MKEFKTIIFLLTICVTTFGQSKQDAREESTAKTENIIVLPREGGVYILCNDYNSLREGASYSKEDSLNNCHYVHSFTTDHKDIYYLKEFNLYNTLKSEGFAKAVWDERKFLGIKLKPKTFQFIKDGAWKFYDNNGNKISDCCFNEGKQCSGCLWYRYDVNNKVIETYSNDH